MIELLFKSSVVKRHMFHYLIFCHLIYIQRCIFPRPDKLKTKMLLMKNYQAHPGGHLERFSFLNVIILLCIYAYWSLLLLCHSLNVHQFLKFPEQHRLTFFLRYLFSILGCRRCLLMNLHLTGRVRGLWYLVKEFQKLKCSMEGSTDFSFHYFIHFA